MNKRAPMATSNGLLTQRAAAPCLAPRQCTMYVVASKAPCTAPALCFSGITRLLPAHNQRRRNLVSAVEADGGKEATAPDALATVTAFADPDVEAPFLEPAVRSFTLGVGAGVLMELGHVLSQLTRFATLTSAAGEAVVVPEVAQALAPLVAWDNLAAIVCCVAFYGMEVSAILPVLKEHKDSRKAAQAITQLPTLPKMLMPLDLVTVKRALYALIALRNPSAALSHASAFLGGVTSDPRAGTAVLDRPRATPPTPPIGAPGSQLPPIPGGDERLGGAPHAGGRTVVAPPRSGRPGIQRTRSPSPKPLPGSTAKPGERRTQRGPGLAPGAWDPALGTPASRRARELRERRAYLKNFWYVAALSSSLKADTPMEVKLLGRTLVLFRDEAGAVRCLDNLCPHRGAPLAQGWTKDVGGHTCVVCPYHGWAFDGEGKVTEVPSSLDQARLPKRPLVDTYPVVEQDGFVWLFFGSSSMPADERPPIPSCPELSDPAWQPVYGEMEFDAPHWSVFDNAVDMAHIHYLHGDSFGNSSKPVIRDMVAHRDTWGIHGSFHIHNKPVNALWEWTAVASVPVEYKAFLPSTSYVKITLGQGVQMITFVNTVPIDANRSVNRFCLIRNFAGWDGFDVWAKDAMYKILGEDKVMVERLQPELMRAEVSLEADLPQIAFRRLRQEWVAMGYCVDPEVVAAPTGTLGV